MNYHNNLNISTFFHRIWVGEEERRIPLFSLVVWWSPLMDVLGYPWVPLTPTNLTKKIHTILPNYLWEIWVRSNFLPILHQHEAWKENIEQELGRRLNRSIIDEHGEILTTLTSSFILHILDLLLYYPCLWFLLGVISTRLIHLIFNYLPGLVGLELMQNICKGRFLKHCRSVLTKKDRKIF